MIKLVLVDDQELVRAGLRTLAERDGDIAVVGEAADGRGGLGVVRQHRPDVVLMDIRMPLLDGIAATRAIVEDPDLAGVRVVVLTTFDEDENVMYAIRAGAAGYLLKDVSPADLREGSGASRRATRCCPRRSPGPSCARSPGSCGAVPGRSSSRGSPSGSGRCCSASRWGSRTRRSAPPSTSARPRLAPTSAGC
jgi:CheY-like chemotaxis protein